MSAALGLRFCAALRRLGGAADFLDLVAKTPAHGSRGGGASRFDGAARALAGRSAASGAAAEAVLRERRQRRRCRDRDELGGERALKELDERVPGGVR